jgi:serine/threonine protein phosphatase PrpC
MEQCDLFAVFDGHSGSGVVRYTVENLITRIQEALKAEAPDIINNPENVKTILKKVFIDHDKDLARNIQKVGDSGSTATVAIVTPNHVIVAYIGDSPCFLMNPNTGLILPGGEMGKHEPSLAAEAARIQRAGGSVEIDDMGIPRIDGLMVSRAFGDFSIKFPDLRNPPYAADWTQMKVTAHPDFVVWERPESGLLALMSDGLVETSTNILKPLPHVAVDIFKALQAKGYDLPRAADAVVAGHVAASSGSRPADYDGDDLSIMLVDVGKSGQSQTGGAAAGVIRSALNQMTAKPKSRKAKRIRRNRTGKTNALIKAFDC